MIPVKSEYPLLEKVGALEWQPVKKGPYSRDLVKLAGKELDQD